MTGMPRKITLEDVEALTIGGTILGGGGGGRPDIGRAAGRLAMELGGVELWSPEETPRDWNVITVASLGAPTQRGDTKYRHFIRAIEMLREAGVEFDGVIAAENGGYNSFGGWIPAAALGIPVVDCPGDGRAHPTSMMGEHGHAPPRLSLRQGGRHRGRGDDLLGHTAEYEQHDTLHGDRLQGGHRHGARPDARRVVPRARRPRRHTAGYRPRLRLPQGEEGGGSREGRRSSSAGSSSRRARSLSYGTRPAAASTSEQ